MNKINNTRYQQYIRVGGVCINIVMEVMVGLGHIKGKCLPSIFLFKNWFYLKMSVNDVTDVGIEFMCLLNKNNNMFLIIT